ncbi:uncharacterized protein LOC144862529 isoform X1 [Branchiostoma floridae x Branchiostoma japonicum]
MGGDAKDRAKTPKRKTPSTKFWNVNLSQLPPDESLFSDYEDQGKSRLCGVKLRSDQLDKWISAHKDALDNSFERAKKTSVTWKCTEGTTSVSVQANTTTRKAGKRLLSVHFYHKKHGLMVQGQCTKWWMDCFYPELRTNVNAQATQTRSTIKDSAQRIQDAIDSFPTVSLEPSCTPKQAASNDVSETPTLPKCTNPRILQDLQAPMLNEDVEEEVPVLFDNNEHNSDASAGKVSGVKSKPTDNSDDAFGDLQTQFVGFVQNFNSLKDDLIAKDNERDAAHAQTLKHLTAQVESAQKSLESHIRKSISKLNNDLSKAHRDIVLQRKKQAEDAAIARGLWEERIRDMSCKVDSLSASNAELQEIIKKQDSEISAITDRSKELESMLGSCQCNKTTKKTAVQPTVPTQHINRAAAVNSLNANNSHNDATSHDNGETTANRQNNGTSTARDRGASFDKINTSTRPAAKPNNAQVRIFADSLFRDVDPVRAFQGKSAQLHRNSTITAATGNIKNMTDLTTETVILHVGSNDLDNSKYNHDSVRRTIQKTHELLAATRLSFPNAQVAVSQVLQRGANHTSVLNKNIRDYNQEMLNISRTSDFTYIKHKKLSQNRNLYLPDQIHLEPGSGTKHLVADVKRTLIAQPRPVTSEPHVQRATMTGPQHRHHYSNRQVPQRLQPTLPRRDNLGPTRGLSQTTLPRPNNNPEPIRGETTRHHARVDANAVPVGPRIPTRRHSTVHQTTGNQAGGSTGLQIMKPSTLQLGSLKPSSWKQMGKNIRKVWNALIS